MTPPLALALSGWLALTPTENVDSDAEYDAMFEQTELDVAEGRYLDAVTHYRAMLEFKEDPKIIFSMAEALRLGGECADALVAYEEFLATGQSDAMHDFVAPRVRYCEAELEAERAREEALRLADEAEPDALPASERPQRPWYRDPLGDTLAAVGVAGAVTGGVVLALGVREGNANDAQTDQALGEAVERAETRALAGGITLGVGSALLLGGVVRWFVVEKRSRSVDVAITPRHLAVSGPLPSLADLLR
ncbi:MAG: hypothetical protein ACE37F_23930 [Nannocystaceae bacterium]|nr:hypothetical protein [bacterium]